jgi:hypothetical protein
VRAYLKNGRCKFKDSYGNIEYGADGNPKSVFQKMNELKQSATFKPFFLGDDSNGSSNSSRAVNDSLRRVDGNESQQQQQQTGRKSYTRDQARKDKANINEGGYSVVSQIEIVRFLKHIIIINQVL